MIDGFMRRRFQKTKGRARRRVWPIHAYIGPNGSGKSAAAVWDSMPSLVSGRMVLSTVRLLDWTNPRPCDGLMGPDDLQLCPQCVPVNDVLVPHMKAHPLWRPLNNWGDLLDARHCDVIMDEVTGIASSRESQGMPAAVANILMQLRRRDVVLRWSAPAWTRADLIIRETSQAVTECRGFLPVRAEPLEGEDERLWRPRRLFRWRTFDASAFDEWSMGKSESLKPWSKELFWGPGSAMFSAYDTLDSVLTLGHVLDSGRCAHCNGRRTAPTCSCSDYVDRVKVPRGRGGAGATPQASAGSAPEVVSAVHGNDREKCEAAPASLGDALMIMAASVPGGSESAGR